MDIVPSKYKILQYFVQDGKNCTHVMVQTPDKNLIIVEIEVREHLGIPVQKNSTSIVSASLKLHFKNKLRLKMCYLTHIGLDLMEVAGYSFLFAEARPQIGKFKMGEKFFFPMLYLKQSELTPTGEGKKLRYYLEREPKASIFYDLINKSDVGYLLDSYGPYTLFAPDNHMLEKAYGPKAEVLDRKHNFLNAIVLSYFVPGVHDRDITTTMVNLAGSEVKIANGILQVTKLGTKEVVSRIEASNGNMSVISSPTVLIPTNFSITIERNPALVVSVEDIEKNSFLLRKLMMEYGNKVRNKMMEEVNILSSKLKQLEALEHDANLLSSRIETQEVGADFNDMFLEHVKTSAQLAAIEIPFEAVVKQIRNC